ncbi:hypothetical protein O3G_MSEX010031 [Manduca sexta]|uniref:FAD dependent oxidoreductase domain-containing protein n=1 Tax=Manduca sexta TaxID=7130 RepID=A0A921ZFZ7_MANSE|nr:hypothetical protein O3G_MSEX010031 [Manduca sexta]
MKCLYRVKKEYRRPKWADNVFAFQQMDRNQLKYLSQMYSADYVYGHTLITLITPPITLMNYLFQRFKNAKGEVVQAKLTSLRDSVLNQFDVVVNCTGMGARELVPDYSVYPIRGQVAKVNAPWIMECIVDEDGGNYIIPNAQACVLGGTHQEHNYNINVDDKDTEFILKGCQKMVHSLGVGLYFFPISCRHRYAQNREGNGF